MDGRPCAQGQVCIVWLDIGKGSQAQSRTGLDISESRVWIIVVTAVELSAASLTLTKQVTIQRRFRISGWSNGWSSEPIGSTTVDGSHSRPRRRDHNDNCPVGWRSRYCK